MGTKHYETHDEVSRRTFLRVLSAGGGMLLLSACGSSQSSSGPVTLTFWLPGGSSTYCSAQNQIEKNFEKLHPNIHMKPVLCGTGQQDFTEVLLAHIAAGNPPDATVSWDTPVSYGVRGAVIDLTSMMASSQHSQAEKWSPGVLSSCQFNGKTYGLPVTAGTYAMWFNQELFEKKGIPSKREDFPKTWTELRQLSKEFTSWKGDHLETAGFVPPGSDPAHLLPIWSAANGGQIYDSANHKYTIDSDTNVEMLEFFLSWINDEYKGDITKVNNSGAWDGYPGAQQQPPAFQTSRLAMMMQGSWMQGDFYGSVKPTFERWEVASVPVGPSGSKVFSGFWPNWLVIPQGTQHTQDAFAYLDYLSGVGIETWFNAVPDLPANKDVPSLLPQIVVDKRGKEFAQSATDFFVKQQEIVAPMWNSPVESFASDQLLHAITNTLNKTASAKVALAAAQKACQNKLESTLSSGK